MNCSGTCEIPFAVRAPRPAAQIERRQRCLVCIGVQSSSSIRRCRAAALRARRLRHLYVGRWRPVNRRVEERQEKRARHHHLHRRHRVPGYLRGCLCGTLKGRPRGYTPFSSIVLRCILLCCPRFALISALLRATLHTQQANCFCGQAN